MASVDLWREGLPWQERLALVEHHLAADPSRLREWLGEAYARLRRALARGRLPDAEALGKLIESVLADSQNGVDDELAEHRTHRESMQHVLDGVGAILSGDNRGGISLLSPVCDAVYATESLRWAAAIWCTGGCIGAADVNAAANYAAQAAELGKALDREAQAMAENTLAEVEYLLGNSDEAYAQLESCEGIFQSLGDHEGLAASFLLRARILAAESRFPESLHYADRARTIHPSWPEPGTVLARQALKDLAPSDVDRVLASLKGFDPRPVEVNQDIQLLEKIRAGQLSLAAVKEFFRLRDLLPSVETVRELEKLVEKYPGFINPRECLAWKLLKLGEYYKAAAHFKHLSNRDLPPEMRSAVLLGLGCVASKETRHRQTGARLHTVTSSVPQLTPEAEQALGPEPAAPGITEEERPSAPEKGGTGLVGLSHASGGEMGFAGGLHVISLPDLLEFLRCCRRTGTLVLSSRSEVGAIHLRRGHISGAAAPHCPNIGELLVDAGLITQDQLRETVAQQKSDGSRQLLGTLFVERGIVDEESARRVVTLQIFKALREMLSWTSGQFAFEPEEAREAHPSAVEVALDPQFVLLELYKQQDEEERGEEVG